MTAEADWVAIGLVIKSFGRHGELAVRSETDFPQRWEVLKQVWLQHGELSPQHFTVQRIRSHKGRILLSLAGIESIDDAEQWRNAFVVVPQSERWPAPDGYFYVDELINYAIYDHDRLIGHVIGLVQMAGADNLVVRGLQGQEYLIPWSKAYEVRTDRRSCTINMQLPEGLLEVNAI